MCGIYGVLAINGRTRPERAVLDRMAALTVHRGPDDEGAYVNERLLLGMRRLSIIDLSGGHQPISNEDDSIWAVCNGEIYHFRELRRDLEKRGHVFKTASDSEVLVHLYEEYGGDFVRHLDGMFGFALWDDRRKRLLVGRDRLGIKPVYIFNDGRYFAFSSELKPLFEVPGCSPALDHSVVPEFLALGYTPGPATLFKGIRKLPPATLLIVDGGTVTEQRYWQLPQVDSSVSERDYIDAVRSGIAEAVRSQMVSDVPIGAFLSGGVDSSGVVALMAKATDEKVRTYSIGFEGSSGSEYYNELPYARQVAELFGTVHREIIVRPDVATLLPRLLWHMEEPIADAAFVTTYLVAQFARQDVTVILSGVGGDELFAGYRRYLGDYYRQRYSRLPSWLRRNVLVPIATRLPADRHSPSLNFLRLARAFVLGNELDFEERYASFVEVFQGDAIDRVLGGRRARPTRLRAAFEGAAVDDPLRRLLEVDLATQLPDDLLMLTDKMTMATSLECRVPLLDHKLVELAARIPAAVKLKHGSLKHVMKEALSAELPASILHRQKRGFGAPMGAWLKAELAALLDHVVSPDSLRRRGVFDPAAVETLIAEHRQARHDRTEHLLALMNFEIWARLFLDGEKPEDIAGEIKERAAA